MLGIGFWEVVVILAVAAIVLGPERMVSAAKKSGSLYARARKGIDEFKSGLVDADEGGDGKGTP